MGILRQITLVTFLLAQIFSASAAEVVATIDPVSVPVGEAAQMQLRFYGGSPQVLPNFQLPPNLTVQFTGQGSEQRFENGVRSSAVVLSFQVVATAPGTYTIPATVVPLNNGNVTTKPVMLTVTKADAGGVAAAFLRLVPSKTNVYVGEMFPVEIKVYGMAILQLQVPTLKSDGFTIGGQAQAVQSREQIGNAIYNVYSFPISVSAAKAGNLSLGPAEALMEIRVQMQNRRRGGMEIFDDFFGGAQRKQVTVASEPVTIRVNPLPTENVPPSFNGAIGNFQFSARAAQSNVAVGDPITLDLRVQGRGAFDTVKLPVFGWKDFTFYEPNTTVTNLDALGMQAVKYFEQVIVPQRAGLTTIPAFAFSFFDPEQRAYRTIQSPAMPINVRATGHGQAQPTVVASQSTDAPKKGAESDIVHIKPALGPMVALGAPLPLRPWFVVLQLIPIGLWCGALLWRKRADALANNPRLRRRLEVSRVVASGLNELRDAAAKNRNEEFFAAGFRLLQEQLGERLDLPAAAITEAVVDEKLPKLGAGSELLRLLGELFQACNQARYAGASVAGMEALIPKFESALKEVQKLPDAPGGKA